MPLPTTDHHLQLNAEAVAAGAQTDLDELGIAKNAREEKLRKRDHHDNPQYHEEMARLYRQQVLKEQPTIQIQGLGGGRGTGTPGSGKSKQDVQTLLHKPTV